MLEAQKSQESKNGRPYHEMVWDWQWRQWCESHPESDESDPENMRFRGRKVVAYDESEAPCGW